MKGELVWVVEIYFKHKKDALDFAKKHDILQVVERIHWKVKETKK